METLARALTVWGNWVRIAEVRALLELPAASLETLFIAGYHEYHQNPSAAERYGKQWHRAFVVSNGEDLAYYMKAVRKNPVPV
jgi:hypothetical protein